MVRKLAQGWTPAKAEEFRLRAIAEDEAREAAEGSARSEQDANEAGHRPIRHYLYFPNKKIALEASRHLASAGYSVETRKGGDADWLALVTDRRECAVDELEETREPLESVASNFKGESDGWEVALQSVPPVHHRN